MQQTRNIILSTLIIIAGLIWIRLSAISPAQTTSGQIPAPQKGFLAPDFVLESLTGEQIRLSQLRGKVVLINFWATWCPPCEAEMPAIQKVQDIYSTDEFIVLAINSTIQDREEAVAPFVSDRNLSFTVLLDIDGSVSRLYNLRSLPTSFFIGRDGIISEVVIGGPMSDALLISRVESLIQEEE